ncbi:disrupted in schizophrenia 1 protein isoform X2 [Gouania willdenowi]|uniref:disrupted in schizophrenia 1 protein isoform X2 n=1 Tax=Gouania willdenowi TaxID=441366 RepID=UPI0010562245|nr:disrupted in schizophrenia 1 protein isoform X2 [Gouania willdenowi]
MSVIMATFTGSEEQGGGVSGSAGSSGHKRLHRKPGHTRGGQSRLKSTTYGQEEEEEEEDEEEDEGTACIRNGKPGRHTDFAESPVVKVLLNNHQQPERLKSRPLPVDFTTANRTLINLSHSPHEQNGTSFNPNLRWSSMDEESFSSSFSFIQQSLNSSQRTETTTAPIWPLQPLTPLGKTPQVPQMKPETSTTKDISLNLSIIVQTLPATASGSQREGEGLFWPETLWNGREPSREPARECDSQSLDIDLNSLLSVDSDTASASSVTSGYESATTASEQGWDNLVKKFEGVLQECLHNNRTHTKIQSMMLKLQRLQQKAILDDDYDAAERFGKKLEELCREREALKQGLPSRHPSVALFLERLNHVVHSALQRTDSAFIRQGVDANPRERCDSSQGPLLRRERLLQEKRLVEHEITELERRLVELKERSGGLQHQIQQVEQQVEAEELEASVLRSCTMAQLYHLSYTLQEVVTSEHRSHISVSPPPSLLRLKEQEQALDLSIKEATAKVVMSQRLGSSLRRKVGETEAQLLALHEAKLAAISGNDFTSAKELKADMKAVYLERDRLEALAKRLHSLSSGSSQELTRMKEQRHELRQEVEEQEAQRESQLKESTTKYIELLEERVQSCPGLERIWEADLEACHLFLHGLQLRTSSCSAAETEDLPADTAVCPPILLCTKEEEDCAMLTALGGRWCPEANLQNSEFTKKLEEFLFCMEETHPEDSCSEAEAMDLTERCELISDRLLTLEDELQTAILNRDQCRTQLLEKEVQEVKSTLQKMLAQLKLEDAEEKEEEDEFNDPMKIETEEEDEEEDQYFSDSWDI